AEGNTRLEMREAGKNHYVVNFLSGAPGLLSHRWFWLIFSPVIIVKKLFPQDDEHLNGLRSLQHYRELNDQNMARVWASLDIPGLALIGEFDLRTFPLDHEYIAAIVNARHPGKGTWQLLPKMDHGFAVHQSLQESATHEFVGPFGEQVVQETVRWIQEI